MVIYKVKCYINWYTVSMLLLLFLKASFYLVLAFFRLSNRSGKSLFTRRYSLFPNAIGYAPDVIWQLLSVVFAPDPTDAWWRAVIPNVVEDPSVFSWLRVAGQIVFPSGGSFHGSSIPQVAVQKWVSGDNVACPPEFEDTFHPVCSRDWPSDFPEFAVDFVSAMNF